MIVLDTNVLSELLRKEPAPQVLAWVDSQPVADLGTTSICAGEMLYGMARLPPGRRRAALAVRIEGLLAEDLRGHILPFDEAAAAWFGVVTAQCEARGRRIEVADGQIAAICLAGAHQLATRNGNDFDHASVSLLDPWTDPPALRGKLT